MKNYTDAEIKLLITKFEAGELTKSEWTHQAHLVVAVYYATEFNFEDALQKLRIKITRHNDSVGTPNTGDEGYHETITRFWLITTINFLNRKNYNSLTEACNDFIHSEGKSNYPLNYYSKVLLYSAKARYSWVEPDLKEILITQTLRDH